MKALHIACALALGLSLVASAPIAFAGPVQPEAADVLTNTHPITNPIPAYNLAAAQRAMADWTRLERPDFANIGNTADDQRTKADPPPRNALPDPVAAGTTASAQRAMADWTHRTTVPDTGNAVAK